jgi:hypothetical protein
LLKKKVLNLKYNTKIKKTKKKIFIKKTTKTSKEEKLIKKTMTKITRIKLTTAIQITMQITTELTMPKIISNIKIIKNSDIKISKINPKIINLIKLI